MRVQLREGYRLGFYVLTATALLLFSWGCGKRQEEKLERKGATAETQEVEEQEPEAISLLGNKLYTAEPSAEALTKYEEAKKNFEVDPSEENTIWLGRRAAYAGRYREAIRIYAEGLMRFPESYRLYRHRGHRYITVRQFEDAVADFRKAAELVKGRALETEPDGAPNKLNIPLSNTQFNILYHLGLSYYLLGRFEDAANVYVECLKWCNNDDLVVAATDWLYMTNMRLRKTQEAEALLARITPDMKIIENQAYHNRLLMYKGLKRAEELLAPPAEVGRESSDTILNIITQGYGVGNWYLYNGDTAKAAEIFNKVLAGKNWAAFGYIAAEADLARIQK